MENTVESADIVRFGDFELDLRTGELRTASHHVILQEKPFQILSALLEQPGQMVTREELIRRLWPAGTFVDFNLGLNKGVNRLRDALEDTAEQPRFIETFPKRGYRFVAEVNRNRARLAEPPKVVTSEKSASGVSEAAARHLNSSRVLFPLGVILSLACLLAAWSWMRHHDVRPEPVFQRLSFGRGTIFSARFAADGKSVVYGAAWDGKPFQLFWTETGSRESRSLGVEADILAISSSGEMAVLLNPTFRWTSRRGTLALMPLTGSAPRKLLDDVQDADWSPDGSKLAITHYVGGRCALEFPPGKVLYETTGLAWLSHPRVSPRGDQIAFLEHPLGGGDDDAGFVAVIDLAGHKTTLSAEFGSISGVAWDSTADAIWFSGAALDQSSPRALFKVTTAGQQLLVRQEAANMTLHDVSRDGHLLLSRDTNRGEVFGRIYPEKAERELGWNDNSGGFDLSPDGAMIVLSVQGEASGNSYAVYLRKTDGSSPVRLGDGLPRQFSPDGKWVLTAYPSGIKPTSAPQLLLLPTGVGQPVILTHDSITHGFATLLPGKRFSFEGNEPGHATRTWVQDVADGKPLPITPEGTVGKHVSQNGKLVVAVDQEGKFWLYPVEGGAPRALSGIEREEDIIRWNADGKYLFVASPGIPARVYRVEVMTGRRQLVYTLAPSDDAGLWNIAPILLTPDGKSYAYSDYRILSDLYLASGLR